MISLEASVVVNAPPEKVWNFMSNLDTMVQWSPGVLEVKWQSPISVGSNAVVTAQRLGKRTLADMKITDWEPTHKLGVETRSRASKVSGVVTITMEPLEGDKTRLTQSASIQIGGFLKLIQPYISYRGKKSVSAGLDHVKRLVEAQSLGP
jgi:carbon monoxide dehydrogenase subunit G